MQAHIKPDILKVFCCFLLTFEIMESSDTSESSVSPLSSESEQLFWTTSEMEQQSSSLSDDESFASADKSDLLWRKFDGKPPIPGFLSNVLAIFRQSFNSHFSDNDILASGRSSSDKDTGSFSEGEMAFAKAICEFLLHNGLQTVLMMSNYTECVKATAKSLAQEDKQILVKEDPSYRMMKHRLENSADVSIVVLLTCCGRWQQRKMLELVRDAYIASRNGVVIIGNTSITEQIMEPLWEEFVSVLRRGATWKDHLNIVCYRHSLINRNIINANDLMKKSPFGGCDSVCGKMDCGHFCEHTCHPEDWNHTSEKYRCQKPCQRVCPSGHRCRQVCWQDCGKCFYVVTIDSTCEHENFVPRQRFCHQQDNDKCAAKVKKKLECGHLVEAICSVNVSTLQCQQLLAGFFRCGHLITFRCSEDVSEATCQMPVVKKFSCGHEVVLTCNENGIYGERLECARQCKKKLKCGHFCTLTCHGENPNHDNLQCSQPCNKRCKRFAHRCNRHGEHPCYEPCDPCTNFYDFILICGHTLTIPCNAEDPDLDTYFCKEKCIREHAFCRHPCNKLCGENCGACETIVAKYAPSCSKEHVIYTRCRERVKQCTEKVIPKTVPDCGHQIFVYCHEADRITKQELAERCSHPCQAILDGEKECGHACQGECKYCFQARFHIRCLATCGKKLICGHSCTSPCGMVCPPCRYPCFNICEHAQCEYECGVPCERKCEELCPYSCEHSQCSKKCFEVCDKKLCTERCPETLTCGHSCAGFCGEMCPPYCKLCTPNKFVEGLLLGGTELISDEKFIYLKECGHCIESESMEMWINMESKEILPLCCPICLTRISWIRRYSVKFNENEKLINSVRVKIFGEKDEIEKILGAVEANIRAHLEATRNGPFIREYADYILNELKFPKLATSRQTEENHGLPLSMYLDKAQFLNWITAEWINASETVLDFSGKLSDAHFGQFVKYWKEYLLDMAAERVWPLHPNEILALGRERDRLDCVVALYSRIKETPNESIKRLISNVEGMRLFRLAEGVLQRILPFTPEMKNETEEYLKELDSVLQCTLNLTEKERLQIIQVFGEASGRWFKCANGHIYVVTECGGVTELGTCNECGAQIGGENHVVVEKNYLASEMDGAEQPLYPTALHRNQ